MPYASQFELRVLLCLNITTMKSSQITYGTITRFEGLAFKVVWGGVKKMESFLSLASEDAPEVIETIQKKFMLTVAHLVTE